LENVGELSVENLLARVRLGALSYSPKLSMAEYYMTAEQHVFVCGVK